MFVLEICLFGSFKKMRMTENAKAQKIMTLHFFFFFLLNTLILPEGSAPMSNNCWISDLNILPVTTILGS